MFKIGFNDDKALEQVFKQPQYCLKVLGGNLHRKTQKNAKQKSEKTCVTRYESLACSKNFEE